MTIAKCTLLCISICAFQLAQAYEITTHALITQKAYERSSLSPSRPDSIFPVLGFDRLEPAEAFDSLPPGAQPELFRLYFDDRSRTLFNGTLPVSRFIEKQEETPMRLLSERGFVPGIFDVDKVSGAINGWLMRGAIREDDNDGFLVDNLIWITGDDRDLDPHGRLLRALRHFYDPVHDRAYPYAVECELYECVKSTTWAIGELDPLSAIDNIPDSTRRNHFTWLDARSNLFLALTLQADLDSSGIISADEKRLNAIERSRRFATSIKSLGHVIHLLQDTAQPQHVRGDAHAPPAGTEEDAGEGLTDSAIESFTDYRVIGDLERATNIALIGNPLRVIDEELPPPSAVPPVVFGTYPGSGRTIQFSTPIKFFTTRHVDAIAGDCGGDSNVECARRGLADFTVRNFFTPGTLPFSRYCDNPTLRPFQSTCTGAAGPIFRYPRPDMNDPGYSLVNTPSQIRLGDQTIGFAVTVRSKIDSVAPEYVDPTLSRFGGKVPLLLLSETMIAGEGLFPLAFRAEQYQAYSYLSMQYTADLAIPRAIAYSAGMIDFFFRGRLKIEAPVDGLFAAIDQSIPHTVDADGYPRCTGNVTIPENWCTIGRIFGFTKIRLKVRNQTPDIIESGNNLIVPQTLSGTVANPVPYSSAGLWAVARYHRNPCYQPNLLGERRLDAAGVISEGDCSPKRTDHQEISVSKPKVATYAELNGATATAMTFDFTDDPIPINATDVIVQLVYRGQLGDEKDGIAVGSFDVREPSYVTLWNNTDWGACNAAWVLNFGTGCTPSGGTRRDITTANLCVGSQILLALTEDPHGALTVGKFLRVAVLMDSRTLTVRARVNYGSSIDTELYSKSIKGQIRQGQREKISVDAPFVSEPFFTKRGRVGSFRPVPIHVISTTDAQPAGDMGPLDVGNLPPMFNPGDLANPATFRFPNAPNSVMACPPPSP